MAHPNADLMRRANEALNRGDMEGFLALHADDVVVHVTGRNVASGDTKGKDELTKQFQTQFQLFDGPPEFEIHDLLANDEHTVVLGVQRATRKGKTQEAKAAIIAHVKDGKFTEIWVVPTDPYAGDEFLA